LKMWLKGEPNVYRIIADRLNVRNTDNRGHMV
jgi:hypothetical protein